jgi:hypothetical protein
MLAGAVLLAPDGDRDFLCPVKLFNPVADFWLASYDPDTGFAYGIAEMQWASGPCREAGDLDLREIITTRGPHGFILERDLYYTPRLFSQILAEGE